MHPQQAVSPRSADSPRRLPDHGAAPLSPRTSTPRVLQKEYDALLLLVAKSDSLCDPVFDIGSFIDTMKPAIANECAKAGLPARADRMHEAAAQISNALGQVETFYEKEDFANCQTYLSAAKGNQVALLADIDALKQDPDGDQGFSLAHDLCTQLGHKLAALSCLVSEKSDRRQYPQQQQQQQQQQRQLAYPRPSSPTFVTSPDRQKNQKTKRSDAASKQPDKAGHAPCSPEHAAGSGRREKLASPSPVKRVQGDDDSPQLKNSTAKRQKTAASTHVASPPAQAGSGGTNPFLRQVDIPSHGRPGSPIKVPGLDWSSAKPLSTGLHSPLSTTPRAARQARSEDKGTEKQDADAPLSPPPAPAPANEARTATNGNGHPSSIPASPPPSPGLASPDSPRRQLFSPTKPLKAQPRPRPPSMLFTSPPVPSHAAGSSERAAEKTRDSGSGSGVTVSQMMQAVPAFPDNTRIADGTTVPQNTQDRADT